MAVTTYLNTYRGLFVGRSDDYAMQLPPGALQNYRRVGKELREADLYDHLTGRYTYGTYVMDANGRCRFAVFDDDTVDDGSQQALARLWALQNQLATEGFVSYVERSRRGGHLWVFFVRPALASEVRAWLLPFCPTDVEFYPKQDEGRNGYGSLIRLPLGIHRKSHQRYHFVARDGSGLRTLTRTDEDCIPWFASIQRVELLPIAPTQPHHTQRPSSLAHMPRPGSDGGPSPIRHWNAQQDPIEVIGRYVDLTLDSSGKEGVGRCPFGDHHREGEDIQPSFKVYRPGVPGGYCWYCYTWQLGGSIFDFLRYYYGLDAKALWEQIQEESQN